MSRFNQQRVLVVGGAGFVGSTLCHALLNTGAAAVTIVDNLLSADRSNLPDDARAAFIEGSIADDAVLAKLRDEFDVIFHLATYHGNQSSIADPIADHANNSFTTLKLCEHVKNFHTLKKLVYSSAGCTVAEKTFDDASATDETAPVSLYHDSPYQISKIIGEFYGNYYFRRHRLPFVKARFQNVYGQREILGAGEWRGTPATVWRNVTPTFIWKALHHEALPLENGGQATRDFIYAEDVAEGLMACALKGKPGEVYNIASGVETSIKDLADSINRLTENPAPPIIEPARPWDRSGKRFGSTEKAKRELGFKAGVGLEEGLRRTIEWTKDNRQLIQGCIDRHRHFLDSKESRRA
ncbi:MAG: NAD-dependent epimerase/dehydratase family protein [Pseudomonadota bacterium]|nr:NAD-dependent epimerase/dehydratase family protein [Pseudomonadota bacterium]